MSGRSVLRSITTKASGAIIIVPQYTDRTTHHYGVRLIQGAEKLFCYRLINRFAVSAALILLVLSLVVSGQSSATALNSEDISDLARQLEDADGQEALDIGVQISAAAEQLNAQDAILYLNLALKRGSLVDDPISESAIYGAIGAAYLTLNRIDEARAAYAQARARIVDAGKAPGAALLFNIAVLDRREGNYIDAIAGYEKALDAAQKDGDETLIATAYFYLGRIYSVIGLPDQALVKFQIANQLNEKTSGRTSQKYLSSLSHTVRTLAALDRLDEARALLDEGKELIVGAASGPSTSRIMIAAGYLSLAEGNAAQALSAFDQAGEDRNAEAPPTMAADIHCGRAIASVSLGDEKAAEGALARCFDLLGEMNDPALLRRAEAAWTELLLTQQLFDEAAESVKASLATQYALIMRNFTGRFSADLSRLEENISRSELLIAQQKLTIANQEKDLALIAAARGRLQLQLMAFIAIAVLVAAAVMYRVLRERSKANGALRSLVNEREVLLQELNHRVKNNLQVVASFLSLERRRLEGESPFNSELRNVQARVLSLASIHEGLQETGKSNEVYLRPYLERLAERLSSLYGPKVSVIVMANANPPIDMTVAGPIGMIVCELVSNACKHGFPEDTKGTVQLFLSEADEGLRLVVSDDGKGVGDGFNMNAEASLGLGLVNDLAQQIDAKVSWRRNAPNGMQWELCVPKRNSRHREYNPTTKRTKENFGCD